MRLLIPYVIVAAVIVIALIGYCLNRYRQEARKVKANMDRLDKQARDFYQNKNRQAMSSNKEHISL